MFDAAALELRAEIEAAPCGLFKQFGDTDALRNRYQE